MATSVNRITNGAGAVLCWAVLLDRKSTLAEFPTIEAACAFEVAYIEREAAQAAPALQAKPIKALLKGEYIKRTATAKRVYIKGDYIRSMGAYECQAVDDINAQVYIKAAKPVYFGFTY